MLSIVICTKNPQAVTGLKSNIRETVGMEHEIILIDNSKNDHSIFSAYNKGVQLSNYQNICFMHEDVLIRTFNWGELVCSHLGDSSKGIIGVAGGEFVSRVPNSWSDSGVARNFIQSDRRQRKKGEHIYTKRVDSSNFQEVVLLDGFWLCMRKDVFTKLKFDEINFDGFHAYDIDICLQSYIGGYRNYVVYDILIEHFSHGRKDKTWARNMLKVGSKWEGHLPGHCGNYSQEDISRIQKKSLNSFVKRMVRTGFTRAELVAAVSPIWGEVIPEKTVSDLSRKVFWIQLLHSINIH
jgi:hypothetical protein